MSNQGRNSLGITTPGIGKFLSELWNELYCSVSATATVDSEWSLMYAPAISQFVKTESMIIWCWKVYSRPQPLEKGNNDASLLNVCNNILHGDNVLTVRKVTYTVPHPGSVALSIFRESGLRRSRINSLHDYQAWVHVILMNCPFHFNQTSDLPFSAKTRTSGSERWTRLCFRRSDWRVECVLVTSWQC